MFRRLFLSGTAVLFTIIGVDCGMRVAAFMPKISDPWLLTPGAHRFRVPHADLILVRPELLTDAPYRIDPDLDTIVTMGDSFTEGFPVRSPDSYPAVLASLLAQSGWTANVINVGQSNTGSDQHLRIFELLLRPRVTPDVVVWQLCQNDIRDNLRHAVYAITDGALVPLDARRHWLYWRQRFFDGLPLPQTLKGTSPLLRVSFKALEAIGDRRVPAGTDAERVEWGKTKLTLAIRRFEQIAKEIGFETYYALIEPQWRYTGVGWADDGNRQLEEILGGRDDVIRVWFPELAVGNAPAAIANGTDATTATERSAPADSIFASAARDSNGVGDRHFNESGYRLMAQTVATGLLEDRRSKARVTTERR